MATSTLLLRESAFPHRLTVRASTRRSRALARLLAASLDRRLAEGRSPESHPLLAVRSHTLVTPDERQRLASLWSDLLARARRPRGPRDPRVPINREVLLAHEADIRALLDLVVAPTPGPVRGLAMLSSLLVDGSGPVYSPRGAAPLGARLAEVRRHLRSPEL